MIGNAVPVNFSYALAQAIYRDLFDISQETTESETKSSERTATNKQLSLDPISLDALKFPTSINIYKAFGDIKVQGKCV